MAGNISIENLGEVGKQALALGADTKKGINKALLAGAEVVKGEASQRIPRYAKHRTDHGRSSKHLADALRTEVVSDRQVAGVTVEGSFQNGPSYYVKFVEYLKALWDSFTDVTAAFETKESIDWVTLFYIGTVVLHMPESVFWRSTLRKVSALFSCHAQRQSKGSHSQNTF